MLSKEISHLFKLTLSNKIDLKCGNIGAFLQELKSSEKMKLYILLYLKKYFWLEFRSVIFSVNFYFKNLIMHS